MSTIVLIENPAALVQILKSIIAPGFIVRIPRTVGYPGFPKSEIGHIIASITSVVEINVPVTHVKMDIILILKGIK